jgi:hypothetical protein
MPSTRPRLTFANVTSALALFVALGGGAVALGAAIDHNGAIHACYVKSGPHRGDVRLLLKGSCRHAERSISWNVDGPTGPAGPQGEPGAPGTPGAPGAPGTTSDQQAALAGTSGTPADGNRFVTNADPRLSDARPPTGTAGNGLTGTYPSPTIAESAVGSPQVADHSLRLADMAVVSKTGSLSIGGVAANNCIDVTANVNGAQPGDLGFVRRTDATDPPKLLIEALGVLSANHLEVRMCNPTTTAQPAVTWPVRIDVLRP